MKLESADKGRMKACAYVRVSTDDQAQHGISIPSQIQKIEEFCKAKGWVLVETVQEPGLSGKDIGRPMFNAMMSRASSTARPFDVVIVYSLSRFARHLAIQTTAFEKLKASGVELASVSESFGKGPNANLMRSMVGAFNQHLSDQSAMNTIRTMNANAAEGYWNGGPIPFGYRSVTVEKRKDKEKKKLAIREDEAEIVRRIFRLAKHGDGEGPMGARGIAQWLNSRGYSLRGGRFSNSNTAAILSRTHYAGYYLDGKQNEFKEPLPEDQWITVPCPPIISEEEFLDVAALRAKRSPKATPPRVVNGVTMLPAAIARCGQPECDAGLTVRTGKGGRYHYYNCSVRVNQGAASCDLKPIRREELDKFVLDALVDWIFQKERLAKLLRHLLDRSEHVIKRRRKDLALAKGELTTVSKAITNLLLAIEGGAMRPDEPLFVERMAHNRARKAALQADVQSLERQLSTSKKRITEEMIAEFGEKMTRALREGEPTFRAAYVRLFVSRVELSAEEIRILGPTNSLEKTLAYDHGPAQGEVPIFDREWCRLQDSNL
ncbi:recombinase family protein [Croceibacterium soli]|nr:recombinase family protein [Croceibacterium soli]